MTRADDKRAERAKQSAQHLASARARVALAAKQSSRVLVALSGGKDSLVTLDLCCAAFDHVEAFYMYIVAGLETFETPIDAAAARYGVKVHRVPHFELSRLIKNAVLRPHVPGAERIRATRLTDVWNAMRERTGIQWVAAGERASDSMQRRFYTREDDGVQPRFSRIFPIWDWLDADVYAYLRARKLPVPHYGAFTTPRGSGFNLGAAELSWLKQHQPSDWRKVLAVFPYAEVHVERYERQQAHAVPAVRASTRTPRGDQKRSVQSAAAARQVQAGEAPDEPA